MTDPLFDTTDYRTFLEQALARRGMHQRDLAEALDRAPSNVSQVLGGRRALDPTLVERLVAVLDLDAEQATYLGALVDLDSRSPRARRQAWATVQATQRHRAQAGPSSAVLEAASRWWFPVVMELARCEGFRPDPAWIAGTASPAISVAQAQQALNTAMALGLLVPDDHGGLRVTDEVQWTPSEVSTADQAANAAALHRAGMALAAGCQERARFNERQVSTTVFAISEEQFDRIRARLREVEREIVLIASEGAGPRNRVYQLGVQLFPVSLFSDSTADHSMFANNHGEPPDIEPETTE